jgi:hypothetical protein
MILPYFAAIYSFGKSLSNAVNVENHCEPNGPVLAIPSKK